MVRKGSFDEKILAVCFGERKEQTLFDWIVVGAGEVRVGVYEFDIRVVWCYAGFCELAVRDEVQTSLFPKLIKMQPIIWYHHISLAFLDNISGAELSSRPWTYAIQTSAPIWVF